MPATHSSRTPRYKLCTLCGRNEHKVAVRKPNGIVVGYCPNCMRTLTDMTTGEVVYDRRRMTPVVNRSRKGVWDMTAEELARVVAEHRGYLAGVGGWLYTADHTPVVQGYSALAKDLEERGIIVVGRGIAWQRNHAVAA